MSGDLLEHMQENQPFTVSAILEKMIKRVVFLVLFFSTTPPLALFALDQTSTRMKGLGTSMQGIISDDYTDTIANPARERFWRRKQLFAKAGAYGNPTSIGYSMGPAPFFVLAEGVVNRYSYPSNNFYNNSDSDIPTNIYAQEYINSSKSDYSNYSLVSMSGFGSDAFGIGFGVFYDESRNLGDTDSLRNQKDLRGPTGQVVHIESSNQHRQTRNYLQNPRAVLGFHWQTLGEYQNDKDLILKISLSRNRMRASAKNTSSIDYDPDGNGNDDRWGIGDPFPTPFTVSYLNSTTDNQNPAYRTGLGVEWRRKKASKDAKTGYIFSLSWQPAAFKRNTAAHSESRTITGTTTTIISLDTSQQIRRREDSYFGVAGIGGIWQIQERLWTGLGLRAEATLAHTNQNLDFTSANSVSRSELEIDNFSSKVGFPLLFEFSLNPHFTIRGNITYQWDYSITEQESANTYFSPVKQTTRSSRTYSNYGVGAGFEWKDLRIDLFTASDLSQLTTFLLQSSYRF